MTAVGEPDPALSCRKELWIRTFVFVGFSRVFYVLLIGDFALDAIVLSTEHDFQRGVKYQIK